MKALPLSVLMTSLFAVMLAGCQSVKSTDTANHNDVVAMPSVVALEVPADMNAYTASMKLASREMLLVTPMARGAGYTPVQNTERYATHTPNPVQSVAQNPISTFGADVDTGSYANTRRLLNNGRLPPAGAVRSEEFINYFDYNYPKPSDKEPFAVHTALTDSPFKDGAKILRIGIQGKETSTQAMPPANLVFLVDVSGSMHSNDKLPLVKQTLTLLTHQLRDVDSVSIITYADGEKLILPATYATEQGKRQLLDAIDKMKAGGATAGEQAIQMAYHEAQKHHKTDGINRILLMTDGDFNVGITDFDALKDMVAQKRKSGVSLSTFGFGTGNYNEHLMEQLADAGDGNYNYIDSTNEAKKVLHRQLSSTLTTIAQDVKIQVEFNPATVKEYRLIGYENRVLDEADFNNDNVDSGDIGAGHAVTALYEIIPVGVAGYLADKRYSSNPSPTAHASEYAQLAIRYKLPNQAQSIKQTHIITPAMYHAKADDNTRLALAVATFAELLKGGQYTGNLTYDDVHAMLADVGGADKYELRAELRELIKTAKELSTPQKP